MIQEIMDRADVLKRDLLSLGMDYVPSLVADFKKDVRDIMTGKGETPVEEILEGFFKRCCEAFNVKPREVIKARRNTREGAMAIVAYMIGSSLFCNNKMLVCKIIKKQRQYFSHAETRFKQLRDNKEFMDIYKRLIDESGNY